MQSNNHLLTLSVRYEYCLAKSWYDKCADIVTSEAPIVTNLYLCEQQTDSNMREVSNEICLSCRKRNVKPLTTTSNHPDSVCVFYLYVLTLSMQMKVNECGGEKMEQ